jgi:hypothetical protein
MYLTEKIFLTLFCDNTPVMRDLSRRRLLEGVAGGITVGLTGGMARENSVDESYTSRSTPNYSDDAFEIELEYVSPSDILEELYQNDTNVTSEDVDNALWRNRAPARERIEVGETEYIIGLESIQVVEGDDHTDGFNFEDPKDGAALAVYDTDRNVLYRQSFNETSDPEATGLGFDLEVLEVGPGKVDISEANEIYREELERFNNTSMTQDQRERIAEELADNSAPNRAVVRVNPV